jgi:hypothetical protein
MPSVNDTLFGPLDTEFCMYFYILSVFGFVGLLLAFVSFLSFLFRGEGDAKTLMAVFMGSIIYLSFYIQNRLLYSMCINKDGFQMGRGAKKLNIFRNR